LSKIYFVHAATDFGVPMVKASRATVDEALREAEFALRGGAAFVWIVDGDGHLILPTDQIKARLDRSARAPRHLIRRSDRRGYACSAPAAERPDVRGDQAVRRDVARPDL
jgi:hypothetical protein